MSLLPFDHDWTPDTTDEKRLVGIGLLRIHWTSKSTASVSLDVVPPGIEGWLRDGGATNYPFAVAEGPTGARAYRQDDRTERWVYGRGEDEYGLPPARVDGLMAGFVAESANDRPRFRLLAGAKQADALRRRAESSARATAVLARQTRAMAVAAWADAVVVDGRLTLLAASVPVDLEADVHVAVADRLARPTTAAQR